MLPDCSTLELTIIDVDLSKSVPCSGTAHYTGKDTFLHGDPDLPAEWLVQQDCPACHHMLKRPICDYFKEHSMGPDRKLRCSQCGSVVSAADLFTVLHRL